MKFREFLPQAWPCIVPRPLVRNFAVDAIVEHLQAVTDGQIKNLIINIPPGHAKSYLTAVLWPCWEWIIRPSMTWIFTTYLRSLTFRDAERRINLMKSDWYQELAEDRFTLTREAKEHTSNDSMGEMYSTSVEAGVIGWRAKKIVIDDPESRQQVASDQERKTISDHLNVLPLRQDHDQFSAKVLIQQRLREDDATGRYLKDGDWVHLKIPYRYEGKKYPTPFYSDPRETVGEVVCEDVLPHNEALKEEKRIGPYEWASQFQQEPAPPEGGIIKKEWLKPYTMSDDVIAFGNESAPLSSMTRFMVVQPAITKKQLENIADQDFFTVAVYAAFPTHEGVNVFMLDLMRERLKAEEHRATIERIATANDCRIIGVPSEFIGMKLFLDMTDAGWPIREMGTGTEAVYRLDSDKYAKALACTPFLKAGRYHIPQEATWRDEYVKQLAHFPNATKVDQVDVTAGAVAIGECIVAGTPNVATKKPRAFGETPPQQEKQDMKAKVWAGIKVQAPLRGWRS